MKLDGLEIANKRNESLRIEVEGLIKKYRRIPKLAIILVGDNPASISYTKGKITACEKVGIIGDLIKLDGKTTEEELILKINSLNTDKSVDGIILQLPIPKHINEDRMLDVIDYKKDADGFHVVNSGYLFQKRDSILPATPKGIMSLLEEYNVEISGKNVVVVGRSRIVGLPIAKLLLDKNATVTICHSKTNNMGDIIKLADILIVAIGKPKFITADMVKSGVIVVDVGINRTIDNKLVGDVDYENVSKVASLITPVPKGVGPMTINGLLENTIELYKKNMIRNN